VQGRRIALKTENAGPNWNYDKIVLRIYGRTFISMSRIDFIFFTLRNSKLMENTTDSRTQFFKPTIYLHLSPTVRFVIVT
jgi:hypothetical protein